MDQVVSENTTGLFAVGRRRRGFGPLPARSGLHPSLPMVKASRSRIFGRMASSRRPIRLHRPSFGPSPRRTPATTTSADFSLRWPCGPRRPFGRKARPPRVRTSAFAARPPDLRCLALVTRASRSIARLPYAAPPSIRFLFVGPQLRFPLPSRQPRGPTLCGSLRSL